VAVQTRPYAANVRTYYIYTALFNLLTWLGAAIWVIYLQQSRGLSLTQVTLVDVAFWLAMALGEVPTGIVADTVGRKASLVIGVSLASVGMLLYGLAPTFLLFIIANIIWGLAFTFLSGAQEALLYESLKLDGRQEDYVKISGRAAAIGQAMTAVGPLAGGLLGAIDLSLPFIAAAVMGLFTLGVVLTFKEPRQADPAQSSRTDYRTVIRQSASLMKTQPALRHAILYLMLVPLASFALMVIFLQPQALELGVPVAAMGLLVMVGNGAGVVGSLGAFQAEERLGTGRVMAGVPLLILLGLVFMTVFQTPAVLLVYALISLLTALVRPLILNIIQHVTSDEIRATILSFQSLLFTLAIAVVEVVLGLTADTWGLPAVYAALTILLVVSGALLIMARPRSAPAAVPD
jgi:MFS family permease